jgi:hypothetical protein
MEFGVLYNYRGQRLQPRQLPIHSKFHIPEVPPLLEKEQVKGFRTKVFPPDRLPLFNLLSSPVRGTQKSLTLKWRLVHNLSSPHDGSSVNENIDIQPYHHHGFATAVHLLLWLGTGAWFIAFDAVAAYKMPFLHPQDWHLNGESIPGGFSFQTRPVFGARSSGAAWESIGSLAEFIIRLAICSGLPGDVLWMLSRYVDDFIAGFQAGQIGYDAALRACRIISAVCTSIGFPIDNLKCLGPRQRIQWLGLVLDSVSMTASMTDARRAFLITLITPWTDSSKKAVRLYEVQRLLGHLIFATNVVDSGRFFLGGLCTMCKLTKHRFITISNVTRADLRWWLRLLTSTSWNGIRLLKPLTTGQLTVFTDASKWGGGCYWTGHYMQWAWDETTLTHAYGTATRSDPRQGHNRKHINMVYLELRAVVELIAAIGPSHQGFSILVRSDNMPVKDSWSSKCSKSSSCRPLFCTLTLLCQLYSISLTIEHIAGVDNIHADALSRDKLNLFLSNISQHSTSAPSPIHRLPWHTRPAWDALSFDCLRAALATSSIASYMPGWNHWTDFCAEISVHSSSQREDHFYFFIGYLRHIPSIRAYSTFKKYFAAVRAVQLHSGLPEPFVNKPLLGRALLGLKKIIGTKAKKKLPLTFDIMRRIRPYLLTHRPLDRVIWAILVVAVCGLFRLGELTSTSTNGGLVPLVRSVSHPDTDVRSVRLERSKTDPFRHSVEVPLGRNGLLDLDPVVFIDQYSNGAQPDPLFRHPTTKCPIKRSSVVTRLKAALSSAGIDPASYAGHSPRAGGAQTLEDLGYSADQIKEIGRWSSYCWAEYRTMPVWKFKAIAASLANHTSISRLASRSRPASSHQH